MANRLRAGAVATDYASTRHAQTFCFHYLYCLHKLGDFAHESRTDILPSLLQSLLRPCSGLREFAEALEEEVQHRHSTAVAARANHAAHHAERRARDVRDNPEAQALRRLDADREAEEQRHNRRRSPELQMQMVPLPCGAGGSIRTTLDRPWNGELAGNCAFSSSVSGSSFTWQ